MACQIFLIRHLTTYIFLDGIIVISWVLHALDFIALQQIPAEFYM